MARTMEMTMNQSNRMEPNEFDGMLNEVLGSMANPDLPDALRSKVAERMWLAAAPATAPQANVLAFTSVDRMTGGRDRASTLTALLLHAAAILAIFWVGRHKIEQFVAPRAPQITELTVPPPPAPPKATTMGGGGGQQGLTPVVKGQMPKFAETQITPPKAPPMEEPKIKMPEATIEVQKDVKMANSTLPNLGMPNSPLVGTSMGNGKGTGLGSGIGSGLGSGSGGNTGGGPMRVGGGVSAPTLIFSVDPEFSEEARKAKFMGVVTVNVWVDEHGNPSHVRVIRGAGMGLDEKAVAAVKQYKFKPAMSGGKPVLVELNVEVNFQIF
jgi:protein TonB